MSKDKDIDRYKLCLQCAEEDAGLLRIVIIQEALKLKKKWSNPLRDAFSLSEIDHSQLCSGCPYVLEHLIIKQGKVR